MGVTQALFAWIAAAAIASQMHGGSVPELSEATVVGAGSTRATASNSCFPSGSFTVLEVGDDPNVERKKVTEGCWWQYAVPFLYGYVQEPLGWQLCNRCAVDIEFKFTNLPPEALIGCNVFIDASNSFQEVVRSGESKFVTCFGAQEVDPHHYLTSARAGQGLFVEDDPEIEIENRQGVARAVGIRLADAKGLTSCVTTMFEGQKRLTISGEFAPVTTGASVGLVPTGPGHFSTRWGGDLVEMAGPTAAKLTEQKLQKFSVSTDLAMYVTEFTARAKSGPQKLTVSTLAACK